MDNKRTTIHVNTVPGYDVVIGPGLLDECGTYLRSIMSPCRLAVITDSNVAPLYCNKVCTALEQAGFSVCSHTFPAGEANKRIHTLSDILEFLAASQLTRSDCVVALGGGVTGDMAGFAAGCYLRGIRYVQMPTTLLSAVDSSVGGKTAIDLKAGKNLAGVFLQPTAVLCDTNCLKTLPPEVFADGAAEAIKTGFLSGEDLFTRFEQGILQTDPTSIIADCVAYKAGVVERDEKEQNERRLLNLGHTVGHAIEKCSGYTISHGHAVAMGMGILAKAADKLGWTETPIHPRITACLLRHSLPFTIFTYTPQELYHAALSDKKRAGDAITLVIPRRVGDCELKKVPVSDLLPILQAGLEA